MFNTAPKDQAIMGAATNPDHTIIDAASESSGRTNASGIDADARIGATTGTKPDPAIGNGSIIDTIRGAGHITGDESPAISADLAAIPDHTIAPDPIARTRIIRGS